MKSRFFIAFFFLIGMLSPTSIMCQQLRSSAKYTVEHSNADYYKMVNSNNSIIRSWNSNYQLTYSECNSNSCSKYLGYFRCIPYMVDGADYVMYKEYPVDIRVTDIEVVDGVAYFCGTDKSAKGVLGSFVIDNNGSIDEIQIYGLEYEDFYPVKLAVYTEGDFLHLITACGPPTDSYAYEFVIDQYGRSNDSYRKLSYFNNSSKMSFEDVVTTDDFVVFLGHLNDGSRNADVSTLCFPKTVNSPCIGSISNQAQFWLKSLEDSEDGINENNRILYHSVNDVTQPLSKVVADNYKMNSLVFATTIICGHDTRVGLDLVDIYYNDQGQICMKRLGQAGLRFNAVVEIRTKEYYSSNNTDCVDIVILGNNLVYGSWNGENGVATIRDLLPSSINSPSGWLYKFDNEFTSIDMVCNGANNNYFSTISKGDSRPRNYPVTIYQHKLLDFSASPIPHDCVDNEKVQSNFPGDNQQFFCSGHSNMILIDETPRDGNPPHVAEVQNNEHLNSYFSPLSRIIKTTLAVPEESYDVHVICTRQ